MRISLVASADNYTSKSHSVIEISWNGKWSSNLEEMKKYLIVKEIKGKKGKIQPDVKKAEA